MIAVRRTPQFDPVLLIVRLVGIGALIFLALVYAKRVSAIEIPLEARGWNSGGYCTWASLATLARTHHIAAAENLAAEIWEKNGRANSYAGYTSRVIEELNARDVRYLCHQDGIYDRAALARFAASHGAVVTLMPGNEHCRGCHSVVMVRYEDREVEFWDSSAPKTADGEPRTWTYPRATFDRWWSGNLVVLFPDENSGPTLVSHQPAEKQAEKPVVERTSLAVWVEYQDRGESVRILAANLKKIDPETGIEYARQPDGSWQCTGNCFVERAGRWEEIKLPAPVHQTVVNLE